MWLRVTISVYSVMINNRFFPFIGSIPIISANNLIFIHMETIIVFLIIAFFAMLFFSPNLKDVTHTHENKF